MLLNIITPSFWGLTIFVHRTAEESSMKKLELLISRIPLGVARSKPSEEPNKWTVNRQLTAATEVATNKSRKNERKEKKLMGKE